jgi:phytanoyl-CoA dioxygenase PhyH
MVGIRKHVSDLVVPLSGESPPPEERKAARRQTLPARAAYVAARRTLAEHRDARRFEIARAVAAEPRRVQIPSNRGFTSRTPIDIAEARDVVEAANELMDSLGHDRLMNEYATDRKKPYLAHQLLHKTSLRLDSPYLRFALAEDVLQAVTAYLGVVPVLHHLDAWYSVSEGDAAPVGSQRWHIDHDDTTLVKVWVHLADIGPENGPLTALPASESADLAAELDYDMGKGYRVADEAFRRYETGGSVTTFEGPAGTVDFIDTCRCFHMGSRTAPGYVRRVFYCAYVTPYSFNFADHRQEAPFRELALDAETEIERLVLGAA